MIKKITEILNLLVSIVKARWILVLGFTVILSIIIWLREKVLLAVEVRLPLFVIIVICVFASYPLLKVVEWGVVKTSKEPILLNGLLWKPSWFRFRFPKPVCPKCECAILYREEMKHLHFVQTVKDLNSINENMISYIFECPNHGILPVPNQQMDNLQKLAKAKIDKER